MQVLNHFRVPVNQISYKSKEYRIVITIINWLELTTIENKYINFNKVETLFFY